MIKKIFIYLVCFSITACVSAAKPPSEQVNDKESKTSFKHIDYVELASDQVAFNQALLKYEQTHDSAKLTDDLLKPMQRSPKIAKYLIDHNLVTLTGQNGYDYANEIALRTIIQSGQVDPYLLTYWNRVTRQHSPYWFNVEFASAASVWAANELDDKYSQLMLAKYSIHACPTFNLADSGNIHGRKNDDLLSKALNKCRDYPGEAAKWAGKYLANKNTSGAEKTNLMEFMGDYYFNLQDYPHAAGYYKVLLDLQSEDYAKTLSQLNDMIQLKRAMGFGGSSIHIYLNNIINGLRHEKYKNEKAYKRLSLINNAGVTEFIDYGL